MKKLSNTEAELKKALLIKKHLYLHFHKSHKHQYWHSDDLGWGTRTEYVAFPFAYGVT